MQFERNIVFWSAALAVFVGLLWLLSPILLPFVLGMAIAYLLDPLNRRLTKRGMSRSLASFIILAGFVLAFVLLLFLITPPLVRQLSSFVDNSPAYAQRLQALVSDPNHPWLKRVVGDNLASGSAGDIMNQAMGYLTGVLASLWAKGQALISIFSLLIITPVVAFYLGCDWDRIVLSVDELIPLKQRETVRGLAREIDASISAYVHGQSGVCLILGSYYAVGLTLAGLSFGFLIGVVCGLISFIPYAGSLTALVVSLCVALAQFFPEWGRIVIVVAIVLVGQFFEGNVLVAEARRAQRRAASGLAHVRAVCFRLSVWIRRTVAGRAARGGRRSADPICAAALSGKSAVYRNPAIISLMPLPPRQLAFALDHAESYAREDFLSGSCNEGALALIDAWPDWPARAIALVGPEGSGKTHLATIWAAAAGARVVSARTLGEIDVPAALATGALVVEDATAVADERALFHLINLAREEGAFLLFTARTAPSLWPIAMPDVVSRLRAFPVVTLHAPDDAMLRGVMVKLAADRQLPLDESVVGYLSTHIERSFAAARAAVIALDKEALRQGRPPSRALAAEMFHSV